MSRIVAAVRPRPGDALVEIGPGLGALSVPLLEAAGALAVVEIDRDLAAALRARASPGLVVHEADALDVPLESLLPGAADAGAGGTGDGTASRLRLVGNLPYNVGTPLVLRFAGHLSLIEDVHVMLQKEVVERLHAAPGASARGRLSIVVQACFDVAPLFDVEPGAFRPAPKVRSALVRLVPRPDAPDADALAALTLAARLAFANRRKTLRNNFRGALGPAELEALDIAPGARAETLDLDAFRRLGAALGASGTR